MVLTGVRLYTAALPPAFPPGGNAKIPYRIVPARGRRAPCRNNLSTRSCVCFANPLVKRENTGYNVRVVLICAKTQKTPNAVGSAHPRLAELLFSASAGLCPVQTKTGRRPVCDPYPVRRAGTGAKRIGQIRPFGGFDSACPNQARRRTKGRGCLSTIPCRLHGRKSVTL